MTPALSSEYSPEDLKSDDLSRHLLQQLILLREFDLACERWWSAGEPLVGEFHLSLGQEAFTIGACAAAQPSDPICPSIRGMGVYLSRGASMVELIASFLEREGSISGGRWAHWHSPVPERHILAQTGMLGSGLVTAAGVALAHKLRGTNRVVFAMLGDGATNTGYFHEGVNFAAAQGLPIVIIIENNQYAVSTPITSVTRVQNLSSRAVGYGIPGVTVDGTDVLAVYDSIRHAAAHAREGMGPTLVELKAYRWGGQTLKDPDRTRPQTEKDAARKNCPIARLKAHLESCGFLREDELAVMVDSARQRIREAEQRARAFPLLKAPPHADFVRQYNPYA